MYLFNSLPPSFTSRLVPFANSTRPRPILVLYYRSPRATRRPTRTSGFPELSARLVLPRGLSPLSRTPLPPFHAYFLMPRAYFARPPPTLTLHFRSPRITRRPTRTSRFPQLSARLVSPPTSRHLLPRGLRPLSRTPLPPPHVYVLMASCLLRTPAYYPRITFSLTPCQRCGASRPTCL